MTTTTPTHAEQLAATEAKRDEIAARHEASRITLEDLRQSVVKERDRYLADLAIDDHASRARLTELEGQRPAVEEQVEALARALREATRAVALAEASLLRHQAAELRAEGARRQTRAHELEAQIRVIQAEIETQYSFIRNYGPVQQARLENKALLLERDSGS